MEREKGVILRLIEFSGGYKFLTITSCVLSAVSSVIALAPFVFLWFVAREIIRELPGTPSIKVLGYYGWMAVASSLISMVLYFVSLMCSHIAAFRTARNMRSQAMHHILKLPLGYFSKDNTGRLRKVIDDNSTLTETFLAHQLPDLAGAIISPITIIILLFIFDWRLGIVCLIPNLIGMYCLSQMMGGKKANFMEKYQNALEDMSKEAVEYIRGIPVVKVFQQTVFSFKNFHNSIMNYNKFATEYALECQMPMTIFTVAVNGAFAVLIPVGILCINNTTDYRGFLLDFIFYVLFAPVSVTMLTKIMKLIENLMVAKEAVNRIDCILKELPQKETINSENPKDNSITFKNVSFIYPGNEQYALSQVSFSVADGETVALVGPSGSGKSTIASLIPRFFDVTSGKVEVGGVDVCNIKKEDLMNRVSFVFQNTRLLKASILDNVRIAKPEASVENIMKALENAQCMDIINKFPEGVHTVIGGAGVYLSGGECQRIALARAILKDSPIVVLDEATAFADPENEWKIQKALAKLTKGKTVLMVAHRLSTIQRADKILVLKEGKLREHGTHDELVIRKGIYSKMWREYTKSVNWKIEKISDSNRGNEVLA